MLIFTIRRILSSILVLLAASFIVFMFTAATYDPLAPLRSRNPPVSKAALKAYAHQYHLDQNIFVRYFEWIGHLIEFNFHDVVFIRFNFGNDLSGTPVAPQLTQRLATTSKVIIVAIIFAVIVAIVFGVISGVRRDKPIDVAITILTFILIALPTFWFAAVLKEAGIFYNNHVGTPHIYTIGNEDPGIEFYASGSQIFWNRLLHVILPAFSLGLLTTSTWIRYQRTSTIEVLDADYMRLARAKGVRNRTVIRRHGLRNALIPLVTVMAIDIGALFGGAIITEKVYALHGLGEFLDDAIQAQDTYSVVGWVMVSAIFVVLFNLFADLLYAVLDPRIRLS